RMAAERIVVPAENRPPVLLHLGGERVELARPYSGRLCSREPDRGRRGLLPSNSFLLGHPVDLIAPAAAARSESSSDAAAATLREPQGRPELSRRASGGGAPRALNNADVMSRARKRVKETRSSRASPAHGRSS